MSERYILTFGKYIGKTISECPIDYLDWLLDQDWISEELRDDIEEYLNGCAEWHRE